jgi:hypothetical protein
MTVKPSMLDSELMVNLSSACSFVLNAQPTHIPEAPPS